jgi:hypothetical protein
MFKMFFFITAILFASCESNAPQTLEASVNPVTFKPAANVSVGSGIWACYPRQGYEILLYPADSLVHIEQPGKEPYRESGVTVEPMGGGKFTCYLKNGVVTVNAMSGVSEIRRGIEAVVLRPE